MMRTVFLTLSILLPLFGGLQALSGGGGGGGGGSKTDE